jgi:hypothetical protein
MRYLSPVLLLALVGLVLPADAAAPQKSTTTSKVAPTQNAKPTTPAKKKAHHASGFHGLVVHVHHNKKDKHHGTIKVKHHHHEGNAQNNKNVNVEKTFHVNEKTTFEKVEVHGHGKTAKRTTHKAHFSDVHKGQHVIVHHKGEHATDVKIVHHHKAGKNTKATSVKK